MVIGFLILPPDLDSFGFFVVEADDGGEFSFLTTVLVFSSRVDKYDDDVPVDANAEVEGEEEEGDTLSFECEGK